MTIQSVSNRIRSDTNEKNLVGYDKKINLNSTPFYKSLTPS